MAALVPPQSTAPLRPVIVGGLAQPMPVQVGVVPQARPLVQITTATGAAYVPPPPQPARTVAQLEAEQGRLAAQGVRVFPDCAQIADACKHARFKGAISVFHCTSCP